MLRAQGEAEAIQTVFSAIHAGNPDSKLLAYQYLQTLPKLAEGDANKLWIIPSELTEALKGIGDAFGGRISSTDPADRPRTPASTSSAADEALRAAREAAAAADDIAAEAKAVTPGAPVPTPDA